MKREHWINTSTVSDQGRVADESHTGPLQIYLNKLHPKIIMIKLGFCYSATHTRYM